MSDRAASVQEKALFNLVSVSHLFKEALWDKMNYWGGPAFPASRIHALGDAAHLVLELVQLSPSKARQICRMGIRTSKLQMESEYHTKYWNALSTLLLQCIRTFPPGQPIKEPEKYNQSAVKTLLSPLNIQLLCQNSHPTACLSYCQFRIREGFSLCN